MGTVGIVAIVAPVYGAKRFSYAGYKKRNSYLVIGPPGFLIYYEQYFSPWNLVVR